MIQVLFPHDDGRLWVAEVVDQVRDRRTGGWRVVARYTTGPGQTYIRAAPAEQVRAVDDAPPGWTDPGQDVRTRPAPRVTAPGPAPTTTSGCGEPGCGTAEDRRRAGLGRS